MPGAGGSEVPVRNITATSNYAEECGAFFVGGADDNQEHTGLIVHNNQIVDCATGRDGWSEGSGITILGSRGSAATMNMFHYTRNAIGSVDGRGVGGSAITASRYHEGRTQPVEDMTIAGNKLTADSSSTTPGSILLTSIDLHAIGQRAKYGSAGVLTGSALQRTRLSRSALTHSPPPMRVHTRVLRSWFDATPETLIGGLDDATPFLLTPLRIETRFGENDGKPVLRIRMFFDDIAIAQHEKALTQGEVEDGKAYWRARIRANAEPDARASLMPLLKGSEPHHHQGPPSPCARFRVGERSARYRTGESQGL